MAFFGKSIPKPIIQVKKESRPASPAPSKSPATRPIATARRTASRSDSNRSQSRASINRSAQDLQPRKRKRTNLNSTQSSTVFDDDSSEDEEDDAEAKRSRSASSIPRAIEDDSIDLKRRLRLKNNSSDTPIHIIHAEDVAYLEKDNKFKPALGASLEDDVKVKLYYPGALQPERYAKNRI